MLLLGGWLDADFKPRLRPTATCHMVSSSLACLGMLLSLILGRGCVPGCFLGGQLKLQRPGHHVLDLGCAGSPIATMRGIRHVLLLGGTGLPPDALTCHFLRWPRHVGADVWGVIMDKVGFSQFIKPTSRDCSDDSESDEGAEGRCEHVGEDVDGQRSALSSGF